MLRASWKSLLGRKLRLLLSTFAIVLGVAFVAGTLVFTDTLSKSFDAIFASSVGDVVVTRDGSQTDDGSQTTRTVPASLVGRLAGAQGAARADGNVSSSGLFVVDRHGKLVGGNGPPGIAVNHNTAPAGHGVEGLAIVRGHAPTGAGEVAIDARTARTAGYRIGDTVSLVGSGSRASLHPTLVGLADFRDGGSTNGATITIFDPRTAQDLFLQGKDAFTDVWVTAKPGVSQAELRDQVRALLPAGYTAVTGDQAADDAASGVLEAIKFISTFLLIFAGISLVVGSFLIVNTFSILVAQRSRELALLRALGASRRQVTRSVLFEATVLGTLGATLGLGLGVLLAIGIRYLFSRFGLDLSGQPLVFQPSTAVVCYVVGIVVTVVAAYLPARRAARIAPVSALRDDVAMPASALHRRLVAGMVMMLAGAGAMAAGLLTDVPRPGYWVGGGILVALLGAAAASPVVGRPFLAAAAAAYTRLFGSVGRLAGQNALRNPRRTAATASALMIGLALVTTMATVGASSKASVDKAIADNFQGDLVVSNVVGERFSSSVGDRVDRLDGVAAVTRIRSGVATIDGHGQGVMAVDPAHLDSSVRVDMVQGATSDLRDGTVLVAEKTATKRHLEVGDTVRMTMPERRRNYRVAAITADNNPLLYYPYVLTLGSLERAGFQPADQQLIVDADPGVSVAQLKKQVDRVTADLPTVTVKDQDGLAAEQRGQFDQLLYLIYALLGMALVIALLGVVNTLALSVIERTREVGMLRAIGVSRRQLRTMVRLESVVISVLGALLGVGMGVVFGVALMGALRGEGLEVTVVPAGQLAVVVLVSGLLGVLAAVFPARRAARLDVLRAIATQ
ncbi:MAG: ABC transporter permease [Nocardioidaceae bacterium]|nr:ABC transporter permease [Nocardioidaceae bacterium]NUS50869.1 ABC transporter permease [Nocardioidaceae bacterium]